MAWALSRWPLWLPALNLGLGSALAQGLLPSMPVHADGLGAFRLGVPLASAAQRVAALDRAALQIGPGCDERDQSVVTVSVAGAPMTVMAMAGAQGRIAEVVASAPHQGPAVTEQACQARGQRWAQGLSPRLGPGEPQPVMAQGAARVAVFRFQAGARVETRWFPGGRSCDLSLHFLQATTDTSKR